MKSRATPAFWNRFERLPLAVQQTARKQYKLWLDNPEHSSLAFKPLRNTHFWSVRITRNYRAIGLWNDVPENLFVWTWIGSHANYDELLRRKH